MQGFDVRVLQQDDPEAISVIKLGLETSNFETVSITREPINILVYDKENLIAGATGHTVEGTLLVKYLWVDRAFRSRGIARGLMVALENEAQGRGCKSAFVDTMSYQAPDFYEKIGYNEVNRIAEYHMEHDRIFLRKELNS